MQNLLLSGATIGICVIAFKVGEIIATRING